jgi:hypothetical protein
MKRTYERAHSIPLVVLTLLVLITTRVAAAQARARYPICRENQLLVYYQDWGLSMATDYAKVVSRNRSASTCRVWLPRIRQFDKRAKLPGGFPGGCPQNSPPEPCGDLVLKPRQRASFIIGMADGTGIENPICAHRLVLDSPPNEKGSWPLLTLEGFVSCARIIPYPLKYQTTPGVEIDPYIRMQGSFPRGAASAGWSLNLIDYAGLDHARRPYNAHYDPPFTLIIENEDEIPLLPLAETWCDGGVTIELRGPEGKLLPRTPPPCNEPESRNPVLSPPGGMVALNLYLYDLGYDLTRPGEYRLKVRWWVPASPPRAKRQSGSTETSNKSVTVESNEIVFTVRGY